MPELGSMIPFSDQPIKFRQDETCISSIDMHTGGEPLRIVTGGYPSIRGNTLLEKRRYVSEHLDYFRTALMFEPRGHADMYGCLLVPDPDDEVSFGVIFMHNEGYSTMCGHAVIALGRIAYERGWVSEDSFSVNAPCGRIEIDVSLSSGEYRATSFLGVPSFVLATDQEIEIPKVGTIKYDIAYGGAFYAYVNVEQLELEIESGNTRRFVELGSEIKQVLTNSGVVPTHPTEKDLSFLYGVIFTGKAHRAGNYSRNVCVFADGEVDRSPTGSGVSGRLALMKHKGIAIPGQKFVFESILGTEFEGQVQEVITFQGYEAVRPLVTGRAHVTGEHTFFLNQNDPLVHGFLLR